MKLPPPIRRLANGTSDEQQLYMRYLQLNHAYHAQYSNNTDSMLSYGKAAKEYALEIHDYRNAILSMSNLADTYRSIGEASRAIQEYDNGIRLNDSVHADPSLYLPMYSGMACSFNVLHNERETMKWLDRMLLMSDKMTLIDSIAYFQQKGNCLYFAKKYQQSLDVFLKEDSILKKHPDMIFDRMVCDVNIADNYIHLGKDTEVGDKLTKSIEFLEKNGITAYTPYIHTLQILQLLNRKDYPSAMQLANTTRSEIPTMNPDHRVARYHAMSTCMEHAGNTAEALRYGKLYNSLNDSLRNTYTIALTTEVENRYMRDQELNQHRISLQEKETREVWMYLIITGLGFVILMLIGFLLYNRRVTKLMYAEALNKIISLRGEIVRNRLTPHFISNALALGHNLTNENIERIILLIRESLSYDNEITAPLEQELSLALSYINVASLMYDGTIEVKKDIDDSLNLSKIEVPAMSLITIVENAIKHGNADDNRVLRIHISIQQTKGKAVITIHNPGELKEYDAVHDKAWHGLRMIKQLVSLVNKKHRDQMSFNMKNTEDGQVLSTIITRIDK